MFVICNSCNKQNIHTITHASSKTNDKITIDFSKLGKRCCDGRYIQNDQRIRCGADYNLYNQQCVNVSTKITNSSKVKTKHKNVKETEIDTEEEIKE
jgi:hypothetical protein